MELRRRENCRGFEIGEVEKYKYLGVIAKTSLHGGVNIVGAEWWMYT